MSENTKRVNLIKGFVADFVPMNIILKSNIEEYESVDKEGNVTIKEKCIQYGYFPNMKSLLKRMAEELTKSQLKKFQELHEYNKIALETKREIEKLGKSLDFDDLKIGE